MNCADVIAWLEARGNPNTIKIFRRHGITDSIIGNTYADLNKLWKTLGIDHALALELWKSGVHEARVTATKIAEPDRLTKAQVTAWTKAVTDYGVADTLGGMLARRRDALTIALDLIDAPGEFRSTCGWSMVSVLARDEQLDDDLAATLLARIVDTIHDAPNWTRYAMNGALIGIGGHLPGLRTDALRAARTIDDIHVDHGETGCKTPDPVEKIGKIAGRAAGKGKGAKKSVGTK